MSKENAIYTEETHEQETIHMAERISQNNATQEAAREVRNQKQMEKREKAYRCKMLRYVGHGIAITVAAFLLVWAMTADLIAPVLVIPATYLCTFYLGWCVCKIADHIKKAGGKR